MELATFAAYRIGPPRESGRFENIVTHAMPFVKKRWYECAAARRALFLQP
jgi:hypothetical protein